MPGFYVNGLIFIVRMKPLPYQFPYRSYTVAVVDDKIAKSKGWIDSIFNNECTLLPSREVKQAVKHVPLTNPIINR